MLYPFTAYRRSTLCIVLSLATLGFATPLSAQARYFLNDLGPAGRISSFDDIIGINSSGQIAFWRANADASIMRAVRYQDGVFTDSRNAGHRYRQQGFCDQ